MKKLASLLVTVAILASLSMGCARWMRNDTIARCPRCGATFTIDEELHMWDLAR